MIDAGSKLLDAIERAIEARRAEKEAEATFKEGAAFGDEWSWSGTPYFRATEEAERRVADLLEQLIDERLTERIGSAS